MSEEFHYTQDIPLVTVDIFWTAQWKCFTGPGGSASNDVFTYRADYPGEISNHMTHTELISKVDSL